MSLPAVNLVGTLTADPDLKFVGNGIAVANFTVACNSRKLNKDTNQWEDGDTTFMDCVAWKSLAENAAENLSKGSRVLAVGHLKQETWEKDGQKRSKLKFEVEEIGPSLKFVKGKSGGSQASDPWGAAPGNW